MKKLLLATAIAALSVSAANAAPTFYGKVFAAADYVDGSIDFKSQTSTVTDNNFTPPTVSVTSIVPADYDANSTQINSYGSRLGIRGSEPMTATTDVIYQLEYGVDLDGDNGADLSNRDTFLGLANSGFGEIRVGRNSSIIDDVNNITVTEGYWDNLGNNTSANSTDNAAEALTMADPGRINNSIIWYSPKVKSIPVQLELMYGADEDFIQSGNGINQSRDNGYAASLLFDQGSGFTAGFGYTKDLDIDGNLMRGSISYDASKMTGMPLSVGAMYQVYDVDASGNDENGLVVAAELGLSNFAHPASIYAQYNTVTDLDGVDGTDSNQMVLGGKYKYRNNMIWHAYVGKSNASDLVNISTSTDSQTPPTNTTTVTVANDADIFAIGGGLEYKF